MTTKALAIAIDRSSPVPLYHQLAEQLTAAIEEGTLRPGDPFENELAMAERLDLSRPTVRRAIAELVSRGLLVRRRGIGTTVASRVVHRRDELTSLFDDLKRAGRAPRTEVTEFDPHRTNDHVAELFGLEAGQELVFLARLRFAGDEPVSVMNNWLPPRYIDLDPAVLSTEGLYSVMRQRGDRPVVAQQTIGARAARATERRLLQLGRGEPVLTMVRRAYDGDGRLVEYGDHCYRADTYAFDITVHER